MPRLKVFIKKILFKITIWKKLWQISKAILLLRQGLLDNYFLRFKEMTFVLILEQILDMHHW